MNKGTTPSQWCHVFSVISRPVAIKIRDVNETRESRVLIFFLDPGKGISGLPENGDLRPPDNRAYCVRDNCHLLLHACYQLMFLLPATGNPSYTQPGSAHAAASVCLYREQERPLRCRPIIRLHPTAGLGLPYRASGYGWRQSHPLVTHHICV